MNLTSGQTNSLLFLGLGIVVAVLTSLVKQEKWSTKTKHAVSVVLSLLTGYVSQYFKTNGTTDLTTLAQHSTYLYAVSQLVYAYALSNTTFNGWLTQFNLVPGGNRNADAQTTDTATTGD